MLWGIFQSQSLLSPKCFSWRIVCDFARLEACIHLGDTITLRTLAALYRYRVIAAKVVEPEDVQVLDPDGKDTLTLVTCFRFYYVGPAPKRFIIKAQRVPIL